MASSARPARRYPTDLTNRQWRLVEPLLPAPPAGPAGRPRKHPPREIVNAILYHVRAGGAWRMLPRDFPPWQTVYWYFTLWRTDGTLDRLHDALREQTRAKRSGRQKKDPAPSAGVVDSQSLRGADTVGSDSRGYDAGKKVNGRKRHIVTDTIGLLLVVVVTAASVQDRDGGRAILKQLHASLPGVRHIWADGAYAGRRVAIAKSAGSPQHEIRVITCPDNPGPPILATLVATTCNRSGTHVGHPPALASPTVLPRSTWRTSLRLDRCQPEMLKPRTSGTGRGGAGRTRWARRLRTASTT